MRVSGVPVGKVARRQDGAVRTLPSGVKEGLGNAGAGEKEMTFH